MQGFWCDITWNNVCYPGDATHLPLSVKRSHGWKAVQALKYTLLVKLKCLWSQKINNSCLFERLFKVKKNGVFLFGISFFILEIFAFLYYANEESDDVIGGSTWTGKHWIKNISRNIGAVLKRTNAIDTMSVILFLLWCTVLMTS